MRLFLMLVSSMLAAPALAHVGGHGHLSPFELIMHVVTADHLMIALFVVAGAVAAFRWSRRRTAASPATAKRPAHRKDRP